MSTVKATNFQNASSATANMVTDASGNVSFNNAVTVAGDTTITGSLVPSSSFLRNRIINGDGRVDQRGTAGTSNGAYGVDRWRLFISSTGTAQTLQSIIYPPGFQNSIMLDVVTADTSIAAGEYVGVGQLIEGYNIADLNWGTADAKSVTLSFWVYSTTTGTFCVSFRNSGGVISYVAEYTVSVALTWEYKTITVPGPTTGTWNQDNSTGLYVLFAGATGTTWQTTANAWNSGSFLGTSNQVNLLASATNFIRFTGVQLEIGTVATPFERQLYNAQLAQCQRYYYRVTAAGTSRIFGNGYVTSSTIADFTTPFPVTMRDEPSALEQNGTAANYTVVIGTGGVTCSAIPTYLTSTQWGAQYRFTVASGLTTGQAALARNAVTGAYLGWSAEL
jgi:hypothetical protein